MTDKEILDFIKKIKEEKEVEVEVSQEVKDNKEQAKEIKKARKAIRQNKELIQVFNDLYVLSYTSKALTTFTTPEGETKYRTSKVVGRDGLVKFNVQEAIVRHLNGENIFGVFANETPEYTKFISFDVDTMEKIYLTKLITVLKEKYNVQESNILVSYSGNKGYHVDMFFNKNKYNRYPTVDLAKLFYYRVLTDVQNELIEEQELPKPLDKIIEFRPTSKQGCKLPLGKHFKTGNYCNLYKTTTIEEAVTKEEVVAKLQSVEKVTLTDLISSTVFAVNEIKTIEKEMRKGYILSNRSEQTDVIGMIRYLKRKQKQLKRNNNLTKAEKLAQANEVKDSVINTLEGVELLDNEVREIRQFTKPFEEELEGTKNHLLLTPMCERVLEENRLVADGTRNDVMYGLTKYFKATGVKEEEFLPILENILRNSPHYMSISVDEAIERLHEDIKYVKYDNPFFNELDNLKLTKKDLDNLIIIQNNFNLGMVDMSFLILFIRVKKASKKEIFEASYRLIKGYKEGVSDNKLIKNKIKKLHELGLITQVNYETNERYFDKSGQFLIESNKFKLNFEVDNEQGEYHVHGVTDFNHVVNNVYSNKIAVKTINKKYKAEFKENNTYKNNTVQAEIDNNSLIINNVKYGFMLTPEIVEDNIKEEVEEVITYVAYNNTNLYEMEEETKYVENNNKTKHIVKLFIHELKDRNFKYSTINDTSKEIELKVINQSNKIMFLKLNRLKIQEEETL